MKVDERSQDHAKRGHAKSEKGDVIANVAAVDGAQAPNNYAHGAGEHVLAGPIPGKRKKAQEQCSGSCTK